MKKTVRRVETKAVSTDMTKQVFQVTLPDERWYSWQKTNPMTGVPETVFHPSVTWIASHYPKNIGFYKWLSQRSWDESEALKESAGDRGSRVHHAIERLARGETVNMGDSFSAGGDDPKELSLEEYEAVMAFGRWANEAKPKFIETELLALSKEYGYAGTVDAIAEIDGQLYILDWKTSKAVYPSHEIQVSAYKQALTEMGVPGAETAKLAILQVGTRTKKGWKFTEFDDCFDLFLATRQIWERETKGQKPFQKDYPMAVRLDYINEKPTVDSVAEELVYEAVPENEEITIQI